MYWYGIASTIFILYFLVMFSIFPPFCYGTFSAVISYFTLLSVILLHIFAIIGEKRVGGRTIWGIMYFIYHFLIAIWILVLMILMFIGSDVNYYN